jgi:hypothetical protein
MVVDCATATGSSSRWKLCGFASAVERCWSRSLGSKDSGLADWNPKWAGWPLDWKKSENFGDFEN